jgi:hypothetical protein
MICPNCWRDLLGHAIHGNGVRYHCCGCGMEWVEITGGSDGFENNP